MCSEVQLYEYSSIHQGGLGNNTRLFDRFAFQTALPLQSLYLNPLRKIR